MTNFYQADNLHPQLYAYVAVGRRQNLANCSMPDTKKNRVFDDFNLVLNGHGFVRTCLLRIADIHTDPIWLEKNSPRDRLARLLSFMDWMYHDFYYCAPALILAEQLWGIASQKCVLKNAASRDLHR